MALSIRVAVVGGSLGGLTAALLLRDAGCEVDVYERSAVELSAFGAGIVTHEAALRYFHERTDVPDDELSVPSRVLRYLARDGSILHEEPSPYRFTSWSTLYRGLRGRFDPARYHLGHALVGIDQDADSAVARFANGTEARCDLLVCADGIASTARRRLLPGVEPRYSGYVGWRGTVGARALSPATFNALSDAITYAVIESSHIVAYQIPSLGGATDADDRLANFVWYRNVADGAELDELMTDRDGLPRPLSLHPGIVQERYVDEIRRLARDLLPPALGEMVASTPQPFVQAIADVESPQMAFGRVCLIGDAAFAARPHAAAGTAKACENGWALARALTDAGGDVPAALTAWEPGQLDLGRRLVERTREMGERSQRHGTWTPGDPDLRFGLRGPGA